ncbi:hypothetical protein BDQ12DRAFT_715725 [Crucibulum laeve]|uniref:Uncharacterized protein n=1 Tax=Crucibulum laeve TaxID=68775 RepID=A0A5C3LLM4_9AGAR|nr:hypothetical protein BDQ12DRAFT_715725 [Crucibulum laeve]
MRFYHQRRPLLKYHGYLRIKLIAVLTVCSLHVIPSTARRGTDVDVGGNLHRRFKLVRSVSSFHGFNSSDLLDLLRERSSLANGENDLSHSFLGVKVFHTYGSSEPPPLPSPHPHQLPHLKNPRLPLKSPSTLPLALAEAEPRASVAGIPTTPATSGFSFMQDSGVEVWAVQTAPEAVTPAAAAPQEHRNSIAQAHGGHGSG